MTTLLEQLELEHIESSEEIEGITKMAAAHIIEAHTVCDGCSSTFTDKTRVLYDDEIVCIECFEELSK